MSIVKIRINRVLKSTTAEGFGRRYCIWVKGCSIRCEGCGNKALWSASGGTEIETETIIEDVLAQRDLIEGITFLGGEPFDQVESVAQIAEYVQKQGYSVMTFTGYSYDALLKENNVHINNLIDNTDVLIDGRFEKEKKDFSRPWVGSSNQNYYFLTERYALFKDCLDQFKNKFELRIRENGEIQINGMGDLEVLLEKLSMQT